MPEKVEVKKAEKKPEPAKATPKKEEAKGKKRKTNGFKLFMSQIFMFAGIGGLGYALAFKSDEMSALKANANKALLKVGTQK